MTSSPENGGDNDATRDRQAQDEAFAASLTQLLRSSERSLDFVARSRLAAARARALDSLRPVSAAREALQWPLLGSALAAVTVLAVVFLAGPASLPLGPAGIGGPQTIETVPAADGDNRLTSADIADFLDDGGDRIAVYENLDFYQWYAEADGNA